MSEGVFEIYRGGKMVASFPNEAGVRAHLEAERTIWRPFLDEVAKDGTFTSLGRQYGGTLSSDDFELVFDRLLGSLQSPQTFREALGQYARGTAPVPPASSSLEGRLILSLLEEDRKEEAMSVFLVILRADGVFDDNGRRNVSEQLQAGRQLIRGAIAAEAVFAKRPSAKELGAAKRAASASLKSLEAEVEKAINLNDQHDADMQLFRSQWEQNAATLRRDADRMKALASRRERNRQSRHITWAAKAQHDIDNRLKRADDMVAEIDAKSRSRNEERETEFQALKDLFHTQLRLRAPVALWKERQSDHSKASQRAFWTFVVFGIFAILLGIIVPASYGDTIAASFHTQVCDAADPPACTREFSAKGPLMLAGLLVVMSVTLWMVRLQYRIYLSERHLSLDASEKKAFAETYLAMKEGASVDPASEAIVLASLFRPTQDGIIKDDDGGMDFSAAAIIAKQLGRPGA